MVIISAMSKTEEQTDLFADCPTFNTLSPKHQDFVLAYLREYNITKAYQEVYPDSSYDAARSSGCYLLTIPNVKAAVDEVRPILHANMVADAQEIREFWSSVKRSNITDIIKFNEDGLTFVKNSDELPRDVSRLIKEIRVNTKVSAKGDWTESEIKFKMHDAIKASKLLAQSHGMLVDKKETTLKGEIKFAIADFADDDEEEDGD